MKNQITKNFFKKGFIKHRIINLLMETGKKLLISAILSVVFLIVAINCVSATLTVTPATSGILSGTSAVLNASSSYITEMLNCSWYASSTSTANSTAVLIRNITNSSISQTYLNTTFNSNLLEDSNDYVVYAICYNGTYTNETSASSTGVVIDNTIPQTPSSLSPSASSTDDDGAVTFSGTVTGVNTTGCTLYFSGKNPGASSYTMTHSSNTCTYSFTSMPEETYDYYITASDGTNTTDSATTRFDISIDTPANYLFVEEKKSIAQEQTFSISELGDVGNGVKIGVFIFAILIIVVIVIARK